MKKKGKERKERKEGRKGGKFEETRLFLSHSIENDNICGM
jgi:hypothetical protein